MRSIPTILVALLMAVTHSVAPLLHAHLDGRVPVAQGIHLHLDGVGVPGSTDTGLQVATDADSRAVGLTAEMKRGWRLDLEQVFLPVAAVPPVAFAPPVALVATEAAMPRPAPPPFARPPAQAPPLPHSA